MSHDNLLQKMEKLFLIWFAIILFCRFSDGQKSSRSVEPVCGHSTDLQLMYKLLEEKLILNQEVQALKKTVENLQAKLLKLENDIKEDHRPIYIPGPKVNIAKDYKTVTQSSEWPSPRHPADQAVDGNTNTYSHTAIETNPWWSMEFCNDVIIGKVTLRNRSDCCDNQMGNIVVTVDGVRCGGFDGTIGVGNSIDITCPKPLIGKVLKIQSMQNSVLSISELKVFSSACN